MKLEIDNVELYFGKKLILKSVFLTAEENQVVGIFGRNGSGKTSLLKIIYGSLQPKYKLLRINKKPVLKKFYKTDWVAYLPQYHFLPTHLNLQQIFSAYKISWAIFIENFESFAIYKNSKPKALSGGERRIIEVYLILNSSSKVLLLDEPFSNLAPLIIEKIKLLIEEKKKSKIIIITDHFYRDVLAISDEIYLARNQQISAIKSKKDLIDYGYLI
ncbi:ATP-binding cassette domain-containing protein [Mesonia aquimarina]|uniref:ATP-binding cassette domain-containing protein n=1 Tax=Mesonia aquimarina TaxID=1504967 RepID=UPI000EF5CEBE|nr:ABC transporter ATP-binding protein [Mesonia aquimarina]